MTALADRTLRDLVPVLDRYRPVVLAATAILVTVAVLPGATGGSSPAAPAAFDAGPVDDGATGVAAPDPGGADDQGSAPAPAPAAPPAPAGASTSFMPPAPTRRAAPPPASGAPATPSTPTDVSEPETSAGGSAPLQIVVSAWASSTGGTPLPTDVPDGSLPVGARIDQVDKASYIRLEGSESTLVLTEIADGRRGSDFETSPVQACQITDTGWDAGENLAFDEAPAHDPDDCVAATQANDGTWSILLAGFADPTDDRGIALVPSPDAPLDFQVTFASVVAG